MLNDLGPCAEISWDRLIERVGSETVDRLIKAADFVGAVNWGKLVNVGTIWRNLAARHRATPPGRNLGGRSRPFLSLPRPSSAPSTSSTSLAGLDAGQRRRGQGKQSWGSR